MSDVYYSQIELPIGSIYLAASEQGICRIELPGDDKQTFFAWLQKNFDNCTQQETMVINQAAFEIIEYFSPKRTKFTVPLHLIGTEFERKVWNELTRIPFGTTVSYGTIAARIGSPKASRAVGRANHKNPVPIIVPCHRVIGTNGSLVGYGGGLALKKYLLDLEKHYPIYCLY